MKLVKVHIKNYRSIEDSTEFEIEPDVTCLVGKNESGKTAVLQALHKLKSPLGVQFEVTKDYPRRSMAIYERTHAANPAVVVVATFELDDHEVSALEDFLAPGALSSRQLRISKNYANRITAELVLDEQKIVQHWAASTTGIDPRAQTAASTSRTVADFVRALQALEQTETVKALIARATPLAGQVSQVAWQQKLEPQFPSFLFFDEYSVMRGQALLEQLAQPNARNDQNLVPLVDLLELASTSATALRNEPNRYEEHKARLEAAANRITDEVFNYWSQNQNLEVEFDVSAPANQPNQQMLHVRIRNTRHRVTVPFDERSRGFVWFFSFLARFDRIAQDGKPLILLLDEPALSLHASAQDDFLRFIEERLAPNHQVLFTTHSPFMIDPARLHRVRTVEDLPKKGTVVSKDVLVADHATSFPLQAALGYTMTQSLFIGPNCLLVEGASDLIYLQVMSEAARKAGKTTLDGRWVITPVGGADRLAVFATLLGANKLNIAVLMDFSNAEQQRLGRLIDESRLDPKQILRVSEFLSRTRDADIEDLFDVATYLRLVRAAYPTSPPLTEAGLPPDARLVKRVEKALAAAGFAGFDHFAPAQAAVREFATTPPPTAVIDAFERLFVRVNGLLH